MSCEKIRRIASQTLRALGLRSGVLSVLLVGDRKMQSLNRRYLQHDRPTDVIAFGGLLDSGRLEATQGRPYLGDIVISVDTARRQARSYGNSFSYELMFYLCHGILHLRGYRDKTVKGASAMEGKQKTLLKKIGIKNTPSR
ncbi:MAG: rRNA maturation RNase YbeY [Candidatus Omnitrophota bacterium]|nr:rRNA maturation RNase YbeY [Candidatus Omnitrophota bacterium]